MENKKRIHTEEQLGVVNYTEDCVVNACAGSGKTSTIEECIRVRNEKSPSSKMLYIVLNKEMQKSTKEKLKQYGNVDVLTFHGLAYSYLGNKFKNKLVNDITIVKIINDLNLDFQKREDYLIGYYVHYFLNEFMKNEASSFAELIMGYELPQEVSKFKMNILKFCEKYWKEMKNPWSENIGITHNGYLKLLQLDLKTVIDKYDYVFVDEAQDLDPVIASIINQQIRSKQKLFVGDSNQQIYSWRGSVDMLSKVKGKRMSLTKSFRVGEEVAELCMKILNKYKDIYKFSDNKYYMEGVNKNQGIVENCNTDKPLTILCRTNGMIFNKAVEFIGDKYNVHFIGGSQNYGFGMVKDAYEFSKGKKPNSTELKEFPSFSAMKDIAELNKDKKIQFLIKTIEEYGNEIPGIVTNLSNHESNIDKADIILTNVHQSKGLEFPNLKIENDFLEYKSIKPLKDKKVLDEEKLNEELNLIYVALTRANGHIELDKQNKMIIAQQKLLEVN